MAVLGISSWFLTLGNLVHDFVVAVAGILPSPRVFFTVH